MLSSLSYAILALLATKPHSGYDLARQMRPPLGFLWQAQHGQIYPELARLVRSHLVSFETVDKRSGPPRRVHSITLKGKAELASWVMQPPQTRPANDELVVKAYALHRISATSAETLLRDQVDAHQRRLAALEQLADAVKTRMKSSSRVASARFGEYAALRKASGAEREYIGWCRWLLGELPSRQGARKPAARARALRKP